MSNVCGLRKCWSTSAFSESHEDDSSVLASSLSTSMQNLCATTNEQFTVTVHDSQDDVEETIYLEETANNGTKSLLDEERLAHCEIDQDLIQAKSLCYFDVIPSELTIKILSYIPLKELYLNVALVCKTWKDFALSPILWQHLDTQDTQFMTSECLTYIICKHCSLLKSLDLRYNDNICHLDMLAIAKACPLLQDLTLSFCGEIHRTVKIFAQNCLSLQHLNIEGSNITDNCLKHLAALPLKSLNVSHCIHLTDEGLKFITSSCKNLIAINFDGVQWITDSAVFVLVQNCYQTLERLWLDGDNLTDASVQAIAKCKKLKVFSLSFCDNLTDETLTAIQQMKKLYSLRLKKGVGFSATAFLDLFVHLDVNLMENLSGLLILSLPECPTLDDDAVQLLAQSCPNLVILDLSWCWDITDPGLRQVIVNCSRMKRLNICGLTDVLGECLVDLPKHMPHLEYLDASQCNSMSDEVLYELVETVPDLTVIDYYSTVLRPRGSENDGRIFKVNGPSTDVQLIEQIL